MVPFMEPLYYYYLGTHGPFRFGTLEGWQAEALRRKRAGGYGSWFGV